MRNLIVALLCILPFVRTFAGHHHESDLAKKHPQLDLTDIFVFPSITKGKTVFVMSFNPQSQANSFNNYSTEGIYRFCISSDKQFKQGLSPTFTFQNNKIQFYLPK